LRDILDRRQFNIVSAMLAQWCTNVMRSKVEPMRHQITPDQRLHRSYNGLFQTAKRAREYTRLQTMKTVLFLIAGQLDFKAINPHAA
jgi:hypothetical protein